MRSSRSLIAALGLIFAAAPAFAQEPVLDIEATYTYQSEGTTHVPFQVNADGAFVARGTARDVNNMNGCAPYLPETGAGTRFMWDPCRGALRFGRVTDVNPTAWDDENMNDFTFAGGNNVTASGYGAFAFGHQVSVSSHVGVGFGSGITVSGTAGFSTGGSNICSGFGCTAMGLGNSATGEGSVAQGYRVHARGNYTVALGYRAQSCSAPALRSASEACMGRTYTGGFLFGDQSTLSHLIPTADNQFVARAAGGVRFYTAGGSSNSIYVPTAGVYLDAGGSSWNVVSDSTRKTDIAALDGEALLDRLAQLPISTWRYKAEADRDGMAIRHVGPMAQDWQRLVAGPLGLNAEDTVINQGDLDGVALAAAQALEARTTALAADNASLRAENDDLRARLDRIEAEVRQHHPLERAASLLGGLGLLAAGLGLALVARRRA